MSFKHANLLQASFPGTSYLLFYQVPVSAEAEIPILWPPDAKSWLIWKDWCWERLKAGGKGDDRGWDGWMASPTQWTWVWVNSGNWWWTRRPGVLQSMGSQRVRHNWVTEVKWTEYLILLAFDILFYLLFIQFFFKYQGGNVQDFLRDLFDLQKWFVRWNLPY